MNTRHQCKYEGRTARFNLPVCRRRSKLRLLLDALLEPPTRLHRYRNLSTRVLEDAFDKMDCGRCT